MRPPGREPTPEAGSGAGDSLGRRDDTIVVLGTRFSGVFRCLFRGGPDDGTVEFVRGDPPMTCRRVEYFGHYAVIEREDARTVVYSWCPFGPAVAA